MSPLIQPFLRLLFVVLLLGVLSAPAAARPCKTLFISSYSISFHPNFPDQNNPNSAGTAGILTIFTYIRQFNPHPLTFLAATEDPRPIERASRLGLGLGFDPDSLRDRTKDVLSVVVALLFGVGCGALTAATMYLGWSLFSDGHRYSDLDYDDFEDDDADMSPKKAGYAKIPPPTADVSRRHKLLGDVKILPGDATSAGDVKIPLCPADAYARPGDAAPAGDVKIPPSPAGDVKIPPSPAGDVKIPPSPAYSPAAGNVKTPPRSTRDASPAGDAEAPLPALPYNPISPSYSPFCPSYSSSSRPYYTPGPADLSPAGDVKIAPSPTGVVKIPPSPAYAPLADASPAGDVKTPPRCARPALPYSPISPSYSPSAPGYSAFRPRAGLSPLIGYAPSYYYEPIPFTPVAKEAGQGAQKN